MRTTAPKVFISYSHDSRKHADRVLALSTRLREHGIETILDQYEESPLQGWPRWMEHAIRQSDFVLMICTPVYAKRIAGDEEPGKGLGATWEGSLIYQHLYDYGAVNRRFIPVLFDDSDISDIPIPLRGATYYRLPAELTLDADSDYERLFRRLTAQPRVTPRPPGRLRPLPVPERAWSDQHPRRLINIPRLPPHFVPRDRPLELLRHALLAGHPAGIEDVAHLAIHGMGGIGKSVLASAIARDADVAERFPDGIVWINLGQAPAIRLRQADLAEAVSGHRPAFEDVEEGRVHLAGLLADRAVLVILDDVWRMDDVRGFDTLGPQCRLLMTTRDAGLARVVGADEVAVDLLGEADSLRLLAGSAGEATVHLPSEAREVARMCGYLPLTLAMVGGTVRGLLDPWSTALRLLRSHAVHRISHRFPDYPHGSLLAAIHTSLEALDPTTRRRFLQLAVFGDQGVIHRAAVEVLWEDEETDELEVALVLRTLVERSVLAIIDHDRYRLHDLLREYLHHEVPETRLLHQDLLDRYRRRCPTSWAEGPDDGYFFHHLLLHLHGSGRDGEIARLLRASPWLRARVERGEVSNLLSDFDFALGLDSIPVDERGTLQLLRDTVQLSADVLAADPARLADQLLGRLADAPPAIRELREEVTQTRPGAWLRPLFASLASPGGRLRRTLYDPAGTVRALAPLPGSNVLCAAESVVRLWDLERGSPVHSFEGHTATVTALAAHPNGRLAASGAADGSLIFWDLDARREVGRVGIGTETEISCMAWSPDGMTLAAGVMRGPEAEEEETDLLLVAWPGLDIRSFAGPDGTDPVSIAFTSDGTRLVVGTRNGAIAVWRAEDLSRERVMSVERCWLQFGTFVLTKDGSRVVSCQSKYGPLRIWNLATGEEIGTLGGQEDFSVAMAVSEDGRHLFVGGYCRATLGLGSASIVQQRDIRVWDLLEMRLEEELVGHHAEILALALSSDGGQLVSASSDRSVRVWQLGPVDAPERTRHTGPVDAVAVSRDGTLFASSGAGGTLVWDPTGHVMRKLDREHPAGTVAFTPTNELLADDELWEVPGGAHLQALEPAYDATGERLWVHHQHITPDGQHVLGTGWGYSPELGDLSAILVVWDLPTGRVVHAGPVASPRYPTPHKITVPAALSADGSVLVFATIESTFRSYDTRSRRISTFGSQQGWLGGVAVSPDGSEAFTAGGAERQIKVWRLADGKRMRAFDLDASPQTMSISPSGRHLLVGCGDRTLRVMNADTGERVADYILDAPPTVCAVCPKRAIVVAGDELGYVHAFEIMIPGGW